MPQIGRPLSHRHAREEQARWGWRGPQLRPQRPQRPQGPQGLEGSPDRSKGEERRKRGTLAACAANPNRLLASLRLPPVWPMCYFLLVTGVHHLGKC